MTLSLVSRQPPPPPDDVGATISAVYEYAVDRKRFAEVLNHRFELWCTSEQGLRELDSIQVPTNIPSDQQVPNGLVVQKLVSQIGAGVSQITETDLLRRKLVFENWRDEYSEHFLRVLTQMLVNSQSSTDYNSVIEFAITSILLQSRLVEFKQQDLVDQLWRPLASLYNRLTDAAGKNAVLRAVMVFASYSQNSNIQSAARDFVLSSWRNLNDEALRKDLESAGSLKTPNAEALVKAGLEQEYRAIENELPAPSDRTAQRVALCLDYKSKLPASIETLLNRALDTSNVNTLKRWLQIVDTEKPRLAPEFARDISTKCLDLIPAAAQQNERLGLILESLAANLALLSPDDQRPLAKRYSAFLMDQNASTRNAAARGLHLVRGALSDVHEFKVAVNNVLGDIRRDVKTVDLLQYRPVCDAVLSEADLLGEHQFEDNAELAKRLLSHSDPNFQEFGVSIIERTPQIPSADREEIEHLLLAVEKSSPTLKERASKLLQLSKPVDQ